MDKRAVCVLSTIHNLRDPDGEWGEVRRRAHAPVTLSCPQAIVDYINYMREVHRGDQLITLYNCGKRTKKWWKRIFFHSLECCTLNAHILYDQLHGKKTPLLEFKKELTKQQLGGRTYRKGVGGRPRRGPVELRLSTGVHHLPGFDEARKDCVVCKEKVRRGGC